MTDQVFLFGSFTEDEAHSYQSSTLGSPSGKKKQFTTGAVKTNGIHPAQPQSPVLKENGHVLHPKGPTLSTGGISAVKADNVVNILGNTLGQTPKKNPAKPGSAVAVGEVPNIVKASSRGGNTSVVVPAAVKKSPVSTVLNQAAASTTVSHVAAQKIVNHVAAKGIVAHSTPRTAVTETVVNHSTPRTAVTETVVNHSTPQTIANHTDPPTIVNHVEPQTFAENTVAPTIVNHTAPQIVVNDASAPTITNHTTAAPLAQSQGFPGALPVVNLNTPATLRSSVPSENGDQADWLVISGPDGSGAKVTPWSEQEQESFPEGGNKEEVKSDLNKSAPADVAIPLTVTEEEQLKSSAVEDPETVPAKLLPKSWAALVGIPPESSVAVHKQPAVVKGRGRGGGGPSGLQRPQPGEVVPPVTALNGETWLKSLREAGMHGSRLQPRGLLNTGNSCFLNSTMQAMLSCSAFTHLLQVLKARDIPQTGYPTLHAFVQFTAEFVPLPFRNSSKARRDGDSKSTLMSEVGKPFAPAMFDPVLQSFTPDQPPRGTGRNRQEDAQEFLSFVIDRMHEEILRLQGKDSPSLSTSSVASSEDDDWEMVGPKNRSAVTRTHTFSESAISDIFGGQLRSVVKTKGNKASATVQPFLVLHLDIVPEVVHSVEDALRFFAAPESLEGYKPSTAKVGEVVSASKSVKIQTLPRVLILHLMRFSYGSGGSSKLHKPVQFPLELTLGRELLASTTTSGNEIRKYELVSTVSHHGKDPSVGHYTADSKQASGQWLHFDDGVVSGIGVSRVLQEQAYVLFYKRAGF